MSVEKYELIKNLKDLAERFIEESQKYIKNTVEVTRTVRLPKGEYCENCVYKKHEYSPFVAVCDSDCGCDMPANYVWCTIYGEKLEIDRDVSLVSTILPNGTLTFCKCAQCLADTNKTD